MCLGKSQLLPQLSCKSTCGCKREKATALLKELQTQNFWDWKCYRKLWIFPLNMYYSKCCKFSRPILDKFMENWNVLRNLACLAVCLCSLAWRVRELVSSTGNCFWTTHAHCSVRHLVFYLSRDICRGQGSVQKKGNRLLGKDLGSRRFLQLF